MKRTLKFPNNLTRKVVKGVQSDVKTARFICPECGSESLVTMGSEPLEGAHQVRRTVVCVFCRFEIPLHLGERWGGLSLDEAKREWCEVYRCDCLFNAPNPQEPLPTKMSEFHPGPKCLNQWFGRETPKGRDLPNRKAA